MMGTARLLGLAIVLCFVAIAAYAGDQPSIANLQQQAAKALDRNDYAKSLRLCNKILERQPGNMKARWTKGLAQLGLGQIRQAYQTLNAVAETQPNNRKLKEYVAKVAGLLEKEKGKHKGICETTGRDNQFGPFRLCASSVLRSKVRSKYSPGRALDFDTKTAWIEGIKGNGVGEWLELDLDGETQFQTVSIVNGYAKSRKTFSQNGRVKTLRLQAADGLDIRIKLKDSMDEQRLRLPRKVISPWLRLTIVSAYPGSRWRDTAISEVWVDLEEFNYEEISAPPPPATRQPVTGFMDEDTALDKVMAIEEIRRWADLVGKADGGVLWQVERRPQPGCSGEACLWCFRLQEQKATYNTTFGIYCINARSKKLGRIDPVTERFEPVQAALPLSTREMLRNMPNAMQGWLRWRDRDNTFTIDINWQRRGEYRGQAEFTGIVRYKSGKDGSITKAELRMRIDPDNRKVTMVEREIAKQANFDTSGMFHGTLQVDRQSVLGEWRKPGYARIADFSIYGVGPAPLQPQQDQPVSSQQQELPDLDEVSSAPPQQKKAPPQPAAIEPDKTATPKLQPESKRQPQDSTKSDLVLNYDTAFGPLTIEITGDRVSGSYEYKEGKINGSRKGNILSGRWTQTNGGGEFRIELSDDYQQMDGALNYDAENNATWHQVWPGALVSKKQPPGQQPSVRSKSAPKLTRPVVQEPKAVSPQPVVAVAVSGELPLIQLPPLPKGPFQRHPAQRMQFPDARSLSAYLPKPNPDDYKMEPPLAAANAPRGLGVKAPARDSWPYADLGMKTLDVVMEKLAIGKPLPAKQIRWATTKKGSKDEKDRFAVDAELAKSKYEGKYNQTPPFTGWSLKERNNGAHVLTNYDKGKIALVINFGRGKETKGKVLRLRKAVDDQGNQIEIDFNKNTGQISSVESRLQGILHGPEFSYMEDGRARCVYGHEAVLKKRAYQKHGLSVCIDKEGFRRYENHYENGKKIGTWHSYEKGKLKEISNYRDDKSHGLHARYRDGRLDSWHMVDNNKRNGPYRLYRFSTGKHYLESQYNYRDGKKHGMEWRYNQDGKLYQTTNFKTGKKDGLQFKVTKETGLISSITRFVDGKKQGQRLEFDYQGRLSWITHWKGQNRHGDSARIEDGHIVERRTHKDNKRHGIVLNYGKDERGKWMLTSAKTMVDGREKGRYVGYLQDGTLYEQGTH